MHLCGECLLCSLIPGLQPNAPELTTVVIWLCLSIPAFRFLPPTAEQPNAFLHRLCPGLFHQRSVNGQQRLVGILVIDDAGDIDLRCALGDHFDIDALGGQHGKHFSRKPHAVLLAAARQGLK